MWGNYWQSETNASFNNKFYVNLLQLIMFLLIYVTVNIKAVIPSNAGMETSAPLINAVVSNALFHSKSRSNQILPPSTSWAFSGRLAAPYFEINVLRLGLFSGQKIWKFIQVSYIIALLDWEQRKMHRMSGQTQIAERITTSRIYLK